MLVHSEWTLFMWPLIETILIILSQCSQFDVADWCTFLCRFKFPSSVKFFPHSVHLKGRSPVCILMCLFTSTWDLKGFLQWSHLYKFSVWWTVLCRFKFSELLKLLLHSLQENGRSPVWRVYPHMFFHLILKFELFFTLWTRSLLFPCMSFLVGSPWGFKQETHFT